MECRKTALAYFVGAHISVRPMRTGSSHDEKAHRWVLHVRRWTCLRGAILTQGLWELFSFHDSSSA